MVEYLLGTERSDPVGRVIREPASDLHVPALCDVEVTAALRRALLRGLLSEERAAHAVEDYLDLPITRHGHQNLMNRALSLRENFSAYDATYVALAEELGGALLTADEGLAGAARAHTPLTILPDVTPPTQGL